MPSAGLWSAIEVLDLDYVKDGGIRCAGLTLKGVGCRNPVAEHNRQYATRILTDISRLPPNDPGLKDSLDDLAHALLCQRNHQSQAPKLVSEWRSDIRSFRGSLASQRTVAQSSQARPDPQQEHRPNRATSSGLRLPEGPTSLRTASIFSTRPSAFPTATRASFQPVSYVTASSAPLSRSNRQPQPVPVPLPRAARQAAPSPSSSSPSPSSSSSSRSNPPSPSRSPSPAPASRPHTTPPPHPSTCTATHAHRRTLPDDCAICQEAMLAEQPLVWCKAQCGQNMHKECWDEWVPHGLATGTLRCTYCRTPWAAPCPHDDEPPETETPSVQVHVGAPQTGSSFVESDPALTSTSTSEAARAQARTAAALINQLYDLLDESVKAQLVWQPVRMISTETETERTVRAAA